MNDVLSKTQAGASTAGGERLARFVRRGVVAFALACTAAGALAAGQERSPRREDMQQEVMRDPVMRDRYDSRVQEPRFDQRAEEIRADARRQAQIMREQQEENGRRSRMTPDERSDLRRQINEANRDLYPNARRR